MKIAYINSFYAPDEVGGAEKSVRFLAETVAANGHHATVITLGNKRETAELAGVRIERLPIKNLYFPAEAQQKTGLQKLAWHTLDSYNPFSAIELDKVLEHVKPDIIHTNNLSGFSVSAWREIAKRKVPIVHTLRDYYLLCPNTAMFKNGKQCINRCTQCKAFSAPRAIASQSIDFVVGNSKFILDQHLKFGLFKKSKPSVIYNAYEPKDTTPTRDINKVRLGFIGRLTPTKGIEVLIDAIKIIKSKSDANFDLVIAGEGEKKYVDQLKERCQGLPIYFLGRISPEGFYNQVHWTVLPSIWDEPLARVLFESFSHGVPVIGSATGGTPELLTDGVNGLLYRDATNSHELAQKIADGLSTPHYKLMSDACTNMADQFKPMLVYRNYMNLYLQASKLHE